MKALNPDNFYFLSPGAQKVIDRQTRDEVFFGNPMPHSYQTICKEKRSFAIAARMIPTITPPLNEVRVVNNTFQLTGRQRSYTGEEIARAYVDDAKKFGATYFPIPGKIRGDGIEQLIIFTKPTPEDRYLPFARFKVGHRVTSSDISVQMAVYISDPTVIRNATFQTLITISSPETDNLPTDFLSNYSAESVYDRSFLGGQSIVFVI